MTNASTNALPPKLYKYRAFDVHALDLVANHRVSYSDPRRFNDPLDCNPTIVVDCGTASLEKLLSAMVHDVGSVSEIISNARYLSTDPGDKSSLTDAERNEAYSQILTSRIKDLIRAEMSRNGVFVLAERWDCPLMWSHYGDEHRGICVEFDTVHKNCRQLKKINYESSGIIKTSELYLWKIENSKLAKEQVFDTYFFTKSKDWQYEREWRDINEQSGVQFSPFLISAVYFGMRCDFVVVSTMVKLLCDSDSPINFYSVRAKGDVLGLAKDEVNVGEVKAFALQTPAWWDFRDVAWDEPT